MSNQWECEISNHSKALNALGLLLSGIHNRGTAKSFQQPLNHLIILATIYGQGAGGQDGGAG